MSALPLKADICTRGRNPENRQGLAVIRLVTDRTLLDALLAGRLIRAVQDPSAYSAVCLRLWWIRESRKSSEQIQFDGFAPVNAGGQKWLILIISGSR